MNFDFSDDQKLIKSQVQRLLQDKCSMARCREVLEGDELYAEDVWREICALGVGGAAIPEEYGGLSLSTLELCVVAEEIGRAVAPIPFSSSIYLAAEALRLYGDEAQKSSWLPRLASGDAIGTIAFAENGGGIDTLFQDGVLNGTKLPVADAMIADIVIILAREGKDLSCVLVERDAAGLTCASLETIDPTRDHAVLTFANTPGVRLGDAGAGALMRARIEEGGAVLFAFEQIGGAEAALNMAREYALERYAFGRQIASYQAIKHKLADMYVKLELARSNAYYGAMMLAQEGADLSVAAAAARVAASDAYYFAARENIQTHGGIGFTWEADTQFHYRRAGLLKLVIGSPSHWKERIISALEKSNRPAIA